MALDRPYIYSRVQDLPANVTVSYSILIGAGQTFELHEIFTNTDPGNVFIVGMRDSTGLHYASVDTVNGIQTSMLVNASSYFTDGLFKFASPIVLIGQVQFIVDLVSVGSPATDIALYFKGFMKVTG